MKIRELLKVLKTKRIELNIDVEAGTLNYKAPRRAVTPELLEMLKNHKAKLIAKAKKKLDEAKKDEAAKKDEETDVGPDPREGTGKPARKGNGTYGSAPVPAELAAETDGGEGTDREMEPTPFDVAIGELVRAYVEAIEKGDLVEMPIHEALDALSDIARETALSDRTRHIAHPIAAAGDKWIVPPITTRVKADFAVDRVRAFPAVGGTAARMAMMLRAKAPVRTNDRDAGWLDSRAMSSVKTGNRAVFSDMTKQTALNACVEVLIDGSGSMSGARIETAKLCAIALGECLNRIGVPFQITSWYEVEAPGMDDAVTEDDRKLYTRFESRHTFCLKGFDEAWNMAAPRLSALHAGANNDDGGAVREAAMRLAQRKEGHKILLVLSDGAPCHAAFGYSLVDDVREMVRNHLVNALADAKRAGVKAGGLGIQTNSVKDFYEHFDVVNNLTDLPGAAIRLLSKLLGKAA